MHGGMDDDVDVNTEIAVHHDTYEEYLDSQITDQDLYYLEDDELARDLVELGYRQRCATLASFFFFSAARCPRLI